MSVDLAPALTEQEARRLTERIRVALDRVATGWADLTERVTEAYQRRADLALGYDSWAEYTAAELKPSAGIAAEVRRELVAVLSAEGMSPRAIAPVVGVTDRRVRQLRTEVEQGGSDFHPAQPERIDYATGEVLDAPAPTTVGAEEWAERMKAQTVTGLDGKTYTRPEPKPATKTVRRRPLPEAFWEAAYDAQRRIEALHRLVTDERFDSNRAAIADRNLAALKATASTFAEVLAAMETHSQEA